MKILLRILAYARPHWRTLAGALVVMTAEAAVRTAPAWFSAVVIDRAAADGTPWFLFLVVLGYFGVSAVARALAAVQNYCTEWLGQSVVHDLRNSLYRHLQSKSMSFYDVNQTGQLMSRVTGDVGQVQQFVASGVVRVLDSAVSIAIFLAVMLALDVQLTLVALSAAPVIFLTQLRVRRTRGTYREIQRLMAQLSNILQENVAAVKLVKAYNREPHEHRRFLDQYWQVRTRRLETTRVMGAWSQVQETATALSGVLVLVFGAIRVMEGSLTVGQLFAFQAYVGMLWGPVRFFGFINQSVQQALAAGERVFEVIDWPLDVAEKPGALALPPLAGDLELRSGLLRLRRREPSPAGDQPARPRRDLAGPGGPLRVGQDHPDQPDPPLLRRHRGGGAGGRPRRARRHPRVPAGPGGDGDAGDLPVQPLHPRQHLLRAGGRPPGGDRGGGEGGGGARLHHRVPGGVRDPDRGAGGAPLRAGSASAWPSPGPSWSTPAS